MDEDAVKYNQIIPAELIPQLDKQGELFRAKRCTAGTKPIRNLDTSIAAPYRLNGVRTHEQFDVAVNRSRGYIHFAGQIFTGVMPDGKQLCQQILAAFICAHVLTPLLLFPTTNLKGDNLKGAFRYEKISLKKVDIFMSVHRSASENLNVVGFKFRFPGGGPRLRQQDSPSKKKKFSLLR